MELFKANDNLTSICIDIHYVRKEKVLSYSKPHTCTGEHLGNVTKQMRDLNAIPAGTANENPILDTSKFGVEVRDGHIRSFNAMSYLILYVLQKTGWIISRFKSKYWQQYHMFGIMLQKVCIRRVNSEMNMMTNNGRKHPVKR